MMKGELSTYYTTYERVRVSVHLCKADAHMFLQLVARFYCFNTKYGLWTWHHGTPSIW